MLLACITERHFIKTLLLQSNVSLHCQFHQQVPVSRLAGLLASLQQLDQYILVCSNNQMICQVELSQYTVVYMNHQSQQPVEFPQHLPSLSYLTSLHTATTVMTNCIQSTQFAMCMSQMTYLKTAKCRYNNLLIVICTCEISKKVLSHKFMWLTITVTASAIGWNHRVQMLQGPSGAS